MEQKQIRKSKFNNDEERRQAILKSKRDYYHKNSEIYKLKSLKTYYVKQLEKTDLDEKKRENYQNKFDEINEKINKLLSK